MSTKTKDEVLKQEYMTVKDLLIVIPNMSDSSARKYIKRIRGQMEESNRYVPKSKELIALTWMIKKDLGLK